MRDIGHRIQHYRLSRYAHPRDPVRHRLRWALPVIAIWLVWASFLSSHSLYRLWQLQRGNLRAQAELKELQSETRRIREELQDRAALRRLAERVLREKNGMARAGEIIYRVRGADPDTLQDP